MSYRILQGDVIDRLRELPDGSVDSIVTDPPYELGFMGKGWDATGIAYSVPMWADCLRVLKPGSHLLSFAATRTYHRMTCAVEDAGFAIRDQIGWAFGSGFPKSHNLSGEWEGWGTALKPAWEPICLARKPFKGTVAACVAKHGTGALNIAGCRVEGEPTPINRLEEWSGFGQKERPAYTQELNTFGRWPANLIHDGSDEVVECFPEEAGAAAPVTVRNGDKFRNTFGAFAGNTDEQGSTFHGDSGSAARFFYCAKASREDRSEGCEHIAEQPLSHDGRHTPIDNAYQRNSSNSSNSSNSHPTVKPTALMRYLCKLITPPGGTVLDCFMGSGSTGKAALYEGFSFIGIEQSEEYCAIAKARMDFVLETDMPLLRSMEATA